MTDLQYLRAVLKMQSLEESENTDELKALRETKSNVERLLKERYGSSPSIQYAGSYKKGTMIKESYDLDITCYFGRDDDSAGSTLVEIYEDVQKAFEGSFLVEPKGSAIRLLSISDKGYLSVDVVPGRFENGKSGDVWLHRTTGEKNRLKTNLQVHVDHIRGSGVTNAIRLMKLWKKWYHIDIKTFVLELLVVKLLEGRSDLDLVGQLLHVWTLFRDKSDSLTVQDPANQQGNDLSDMLNIVVKSALREMADATLQKIESRNIQSIFGDVPDDQETQRSLDALGGLLSRNPSRTRPWSSGG